MKTQYTQCSSCAVIYKVTVTQLTISNGMVNCPNCHCNFNALNTVVSATLKIQQHQASLVKINSPQHCTEPTNTLQPAQLSIFNHSVSNSNLSLRSYLNHLSANSKQSFEQFDLEQPTLKLSQLDQHFPKLNYLFWALLNVVLILLLLLQVAWFNAEALSRYIPW